MLEGDEIGVSALKVPLPSEGCFQVGECMVNGFERHGRLLKDQHTWSSSSVVSRVDGLCIVGKSKRGSFAHTGENFQRE